MTTVHVRERRFANTYRVTWALLAALSLLWGVLVGMRLAGTGILGPATLATGTCVLLGLAATLFVAGRVDNSS